MLYSPLDGICCIIRNSHRLNTVTQVTWNLYSRWPVLVASSLSLIRRRLEGGFRHGNTRVGPHWRYRRVGSNHKHGPLDLVYDVKNTEYVELTRSQGLLYSNTLLWSRGFVLTVSDSSGIWIFSIFSRSTMLPSSRVTTVIITNSIFVKSDLVQQKTLVNLR